MTLKHIYIFHLLFSQQNILQALAWRCQKLKTCVCMHVCVCIQNVTVRWKVWNYTISGYHSNEISSANKLQEHKICSRSWNTQAVFECIVSVLQIVII
jgi:hypothetical protein